MEEIGKRLRESTDAFISNFENWVKQGKNLESRETLMEAMHEVRKVVSRVEIEIAISERDRLGSRPLPIPPHRSSSKGRNAEEGNDFSEDDFGGNEQQPSSNAGANEQQPRRQHNNRPGGRRPMPNRGGGNAGGGEGQQ